MGRQEGIVAVSNLDETCSAVKDRVLSHLDGKVAGDSLILLVDMPGGSCYRIAQEVVHSVTEIPVAVVTGVNLPMLLSFLVKRNTADFGQLPQILETDGRRAVKAG